MKTLHKVLLATAVTSAFACQAQAAGFQLSEQSALGLGRAFAGAGVDGQDISGVFYNPASMTLGTGTRVQAGMVFANLDLKYQGINGATENGRGKMGVIPSTFIAHQVTDNFQVGLGFTAPFGLATSYDQNWQQAAFGYDSDLRVLDLNPTAAYKVNDWLTVAAGFSIQRADATLRFNARKIIEGRALAASIGARKAEAMAKAAHEQAAALTQAGQADKAQQATAMANEASKKAQELGQAALTAQAKAQAMRDPELKVKVDSTRLGYNLGILVTPTEHLRIGLSYRSPVKHKAKGTVVVNGLEGDATIVMDAPAWAQLSASWDINSTFTLNSQLRWTDWSSFKKLGLVSQSIPQASKDINNGWRDGWFGSVGVDAHINSQWTVRTGVGYERGTIADPKKRTGTIPDANRVWLSLGASYQPTKNWQVDVGGSFVKGVGERQVWLVEPVSGQGAQIGNFKKLNAILLGAQVQYRF